MHPGEKRLELTIAQHYTWIGLKSTCIRVCKRCENCAVSKKRDQKIGLLPPKPNPEIIPWHTLCIDLVGPYKFGDEKKPETYICQRASCATYGRDQYTLYHKRLSTDEARSWMIQRHWNDLKRIAQQEPTLSIFHTICSLIRLVFIASHLVYYSTTTSLDL